MRSAQSVSDSLHDGSELERVERLAHLFAGWETFNATSTSHRHFDADESAVSPITMMI